MKKSIIAVLAASLLLAGCGDKGSGEKNGTITKLATTGFFCKTHEMEIQRGGLQGGTGVNGAAFDVTIEDPKLYEIAKAAIKTGAEVQITYHTELNSFCRSDSQDNFLTSIRIIRPGIAGGASAQKFTPLGSGRTVEMTQAQFQQIIDNQTSSLSQTERLVKAIETMSAK